jgi:hypothetical protein
VEALEGRLGQVVAELGQTVPPELGVPLAARHLADEHESVEIQPDVAGEGGDVAAAEHVRYLALGLVGGDGEIDGVPL